MGQIRIKKDAEQTRVVAYVDKKTYQIFKMQWMEVPDYDLDKIKGDFYEKTYDADKSTIEPDVDKTPDKKQKEDAKKTPTKKVTTSDLYNLSKEEQVTKLVKLGVKENAIPKYELGRVRLLKKLME